jgi:flagellar capping protein FliD
LIRIAKRIDDYEFLDQYEARLRAQFVQMELAISQWQSTSQFIQNQFGTASSSSSSGGGIPLSV